MLVVAGNDGCRSLDCMVIRKDFCEDVEQSKHANGNGEVSEQSRRRVVKIE